MISLVVKIDLLNFKEFNSFFFGPMNCFPNVSNTFCDLFLKFFKSLGEIENSVSRDFILLDSIKCFSIKQAPRAVEAKEE